MTPCRCHRRNFLSQLTCASPPSTLLTHISTSEGQAITVTLAWLRCETPKASITKTSAPVLFMSASANASSFSVSPAWKRVFSSKSTCTTYTALILECRKQSTVSFQMCLRTEQNTMFVHSICHEQGLCTWPGFRVLTCAATASPMQSPARPTKVSPSISFRAAATGASESLAFISSHVCLPGFGLYDHLILVPAYSSPRNICTLVACKSAKQVRTSPNGWLI